MSSILPTVVQRQATFNAAVEDCFNIGLSPKYSHEKQAKRQEDYSERAMLSDWETFGLKYDFERELKNLPSSI